MGLEIAKSGSLLYHLTELDNLRDIVLDGLQSRRQLQESGKLFFDVADPNIISERVRLGLDKYIPFHFHPYSAFDAAVKHKHAEDSMIYICIHREYARENRFKVLPRHPLSRKECVLYEFEEGIAKIDWDTLMERGSTAEDAKNIKMAEALCCRKIPVTSFHSIAVAGKEDKEQVEDILWECNVKFPLPYIDIQSVWF